MGESQRDNMMGQRVFIIALIASLCVALPTTDLVVPEAKDSGTSGAEFVQSTLKSGGTETQCRTFATDTISSINAGVTSEQGVLAAIDTGSGCAQEGQSGVATATTNKANADAVVVTKTQAVTDATATQATACNAPVTMVVNLPTLAASTCYDYTQEADFLSVQAACDAANTALSQANSALGVAQTAATDAQTSLDAAVAEAARLMSECHCRVQQEQAAAWTAAGTATASHAADWKQAHEVLCALDQTSTCTVPTCPAVTQPTLAAGVADETCTVAASYTEKYTNRWPHCSNIACPGQGTRESYETQCNQHSNCNGFSFTAGASSGWGCLKDCSAGESSAGYGQGSHGYWTKPAPTCTNQEVISYVEHAEQACHGRNELFVGTASLAACKQRCTDAPTCVSIEYTGSSCRVSSSCQGSYIVPYNNHDVWVQERNTVCQ